MTKTATTYQIIEGKDSCLYPTKLFWVANTKGQIISKVFYSKVDAEKQIAKWEADKCQ